MEFIVGHAKRDSSIIVQQGFTFIELLVVIAIIGILASIILASLATARSKGVDATVKSDLSGIASQMEIFNQSGSAGYHGGCSAVGNATPPGALTMLTGAAAQTGATIQENAAGAYNLVTCNDAQGQWAAQAPLHDSVSGSPDFFCVDSNGKATTTKTAFASASTYQCL
jgi:prepilin-type N-terminal cleavage/methylation domain-containing protein